MEYSRASTLFFWLVYLPLTLGMPIVFASYVVVDILKNKLLPPTGKRRALTMFLLRLCFLYFAIWLPFLILFLVGNFIIINPLIHWTGAAISHLQGLFSAMFCLTNQDIRTSFGLVITCQPAHLEDNDDAPTSLPSNEISIEMNGSRFGFFGRRKSTSGVSRGKASSAKASSNCGSGTEDPRITDNSDGLNVIQEGAVADNSEQLEKGQPSTPLQTVSESAED
jgi:hypothetical protein